jgi:general secretion pathway protein G
MRRRRSRQEVVQVLRAKRGGFTLIELLVVVVIIGILASIGVGAYNQAMDRSRNGGVISNVRSVLVGIEQWKTDHPGLPAELVGNDPALHVAAGEGVSPDVFPVKYVPGGKLPVSPWTRIPQTKMDPRADFNGAGGATAPGSTSFGASGKVKDILENSSGNESFNMNNGFFDDGASTNTGRPPAVDKGPEAREEYGYMYYQGETSSGRYAILGVGKNKKLASVVAVRSNFQ